MDRNPDPAVDHDEVQVDDDLDDFYAWSGWEPARWDICVKCDGEVRYCEQRNKLVCDYCEW